MADIITLTQQPVRVSATGLQPIYLAVDISGYDFLDMEAGLVGVEGTLSTFALDLFTGMQNQTDDGWVNASGSSLLTSTTVNSWNKLNYPSGLLRYVRWKVSTLTGTSPIVTFFVRGMARRYA